MGISLITKGMIGVVNRTTLEKRYVLPINISVEEIKEKTVNILEIKSINLSINK